MNTAFSNHLPQTESSQRWQTVIVSRDQGCVCGISFLRSYRDAHSCAVFLLWLSREPAFRTVILRHERQTWDALARGFQAVGWVSQRIQSHNLSHSYPLVYNCSQKRDADEMREQENAVTVLRGRVQRNILILLGLGPAEGARSGREGRRRRKKRGLWSPLLNAHCLVLLVACFKATHVR